MKIRFPLALFGSLFFVFFACSSQTIYALPEVPFRIVLPNTYELLESEANYIFSSQEGAATLVFEKQATEQAFFELFENGYDEVTQKSSGVWVICEKGNPENCFVQNMNFLKLYPLHLRFDGIFDEEEKKAAYEVLNTLSAD